MQKLIAAATALALAALTLLALYAQPPSNKVFNVKEYGAVGDGTTNDTVAIQRTLNAAAGAGTDSVVLLPRGTYLSWPLKLQNCAGVVVRVDEGATLVAPRMAQWPQPLPYAYFTVKKCNGVVVEGPGVIDGNGADWWAAFRAKEISLRPMLLAVQKCTTCAVRLLALRDAPQFFVVIKKSQDVEVRELRITAPKTSPNTDGIDPYDSTNVVIRNNVIENGDDGVAIKPGCRDIVVQDNMFRFGHGASIGSLGKDGSDESVWNIAFFNNSFEDTTNAVRIKTYEGGTGVAYNISYDGVQCIGVKLPIEITQWYCPHEPDRCAPQKNNVNISSVQIRNVQGTQTSGTAGTINCSLTVPCENFLLENVNILPFANKTTSGGNLKKKNQFFCERVSGEVYDVSPSGCVMD